MVNIHFNPPVIAHRGASAYAPENTLVAFSKAVEMGVKWIEFDVMSAFCGEPVIFHDEELDRTSSGKGNLFDYEYDFLKTLDVGSWFNAEFTGERIPTLKEVIEFILKSQISANIELKPLPGHEEQLVSRVINEAQHFFATHNERILFSSFSTKTLTFLKKYSPHSLIGLLIHEWYDDWQEDCEVLDCVSVHVNQEILSPKTASMIKQMKKALLCYTVNDPRRATQLFSWGVDAVFTDVPDKILEVVKHK